jgi:hypothetical protein
MDKVQDLDILGFLPSNVTTQNHDSNLPLSFTYNLKPQCSQLSSLKSDI